MIENFGVKRLSPEIIRRDRAVMSCPESWNPRNLLYIFPLPASNLLALCNYISELAVSYTDTVWLARALCSYISELAVSYRATVWLALCNYISELAVSYRATVWLALCNYISELAVSYRDTVWLALCNYIPELAVSYRDTVRLRVPPGLCYSLLHSVAASADDCYRQI